jgi:hypothetical protein
MSHPKDKETDLNADQLRSLLDYNPETGIFRYKVTPSRQSKVKAGDIAGYVRGGKYLIISINGEKYYAHRLAWLWMYGTWPENLIDHRNKCKVVNNIGNLRPATQSQNCANAPKKSNNTSGFKGVTKSKKRWRAQITYRKQVHYLGNFKTREEAHEAYVKKAREFYGEFFHP